MFIEDARVPIEAALHALEEQRRANGEDKLQFRSVPQFLADVAGDGLTAAEKQVLVDQAILLLDQLYAHLPFKQARYAIDPVQRLRLIRTQFGQMTDLEFHRSMSRAFVKLRDAHTFYALPDPYRGATVFLPFRLEGFHDEAMRRRFVVTQVIETFTHETFRRGAEVVSWNGMPIQQAVEQEAQRDPGGNDAAKFARGLNRMTSRSFTFSVPSDEVWATIEYIPEGGSESLGIVLPWTVATDATGDPRGPRNVRSNARSIYGPLAETTRVCRMLMTAPPPASASPVSAGPFDSILTFQHTGGDPKPGFVDPAALSDPDHPEKRFGVIRLRSFDVPDRKTQLFVDEFARILDLLQEKAPDGLIVDVRGNPGGNIQAGERILQMLTPNEITPAAFHFINTPLTQRIASELKDFSARGVVKDLGEWKPWIDDLLRAVASGKTLTAGRPLTNPAEANDAGQRYQGPVALVVSATSYSATDIFAGGFKDNHVGQIIGVDENTGGGGANRWLHEELVDKLKPLEGVPLTALPRNSSIGIAIRRSTRVGSSAGSALEDDGVQVKPDNDPGGDRIIRLTRRDLLEHNCDLLMSVCRELGQRPAYRLEIVSAVKLDDSIRLTVRTANLHRIECLLDGLPQLALAAQPEMTFEVSTAGLGGSPRVVRIRGHAITEDPDLGPVLTLATASQRRIDTLVPVLAPSK